MRTTLIILGLLLVLPSASFAVVPAELGNAAPAKIGEPGASDGMRDTREGGESSGDALVIPSVPYEDTGATCDNTDDITLPCADSSAPDVVYRYTAPGTARINLSLCGSGYDTALGVYDSDLNNLACNDDLCALQSEIDGLNVVAGETYYIVVDGYSTNCGSYQLSVTEVEDCVLECPAGALQEGEPPCIAEYSDWYNGGCQTNGWTPLPPLAGGCTTMCGRSCTYLYNGFSYRDTDWYVAVAAGGTATVTCTAEFPVQLILLYAADCLNFQYILDTAGPCEPITLTWDFAPDTEFWVWVGPSLFSGYPESDYVLDVCGVRSGGACCSEQGYCEIHSEDECRSLGLNWLGWGTDCTPYPCGPDAPGACCLPDLSCRILAESECLQAQGQYQGAGTNCEPSPCGVIPVERENWGRIKDRYRD